MKQSSIIQLAVFYLILLLSNEGITVATNIRQTVGLRKNIQFSSSLNNMVNMMDSGLNSLYTTFPDPRSSKSGISADLTQSQKIFKLFFSTDLVESPAVWLNIQPFHRVYNRQLESKKETTVDCHNVCPVVDGDKRNDETGAC